MFAKFLESLLASSVKDKPGPSMITPFILALLVINHTFTLTFIRTSGTLSQKAAAAIDASTDPTFLLPFAIAIAYIFIGKPLVSNIGFVTREFFDQQGQNLLKSKNWKTYRSQDEYDLLINKSNDLLSQNFSLNEQMNVKITKIHKLEDELKKSTEQNEQQQDHIGVLTKKSTDLSNKAASLETDNTNCINEITNLNKEISTQKDNYFTLKEKNKLTEGELGDLRPELIQLRAEYKHLNQAKTAAADEVSLLNANILHFEEHNTSLQNDIKSLEIDRNIDKKSIESKNKKIAQMTAEIDLFNAKGVNDFQNNESTENSVEFKTISSLLQDLSGLPEKQNELIQSLSSVISTIPDFKISKTKLNDLSIRLITAYKNLSSETEKNSYIKLITRNPSAFITA